MIYTLTLNPALDYWVQVQNFRTGQINRAVGENLEAGGKGLNVSTVLHRLGIETTALGFLAGLTGMMVSALIQSSGTPQDFILLRDGSTRINIKLHAQEETEINGIGAPIDEDALQALYQKLDAMQDGDYLVLAGSVPSTVPGDIYCRIMKRYQDQKIKMNKKINFIVDTSGDVLKQSLAWHPFLIKPNHHELGDLFGVKLHKTAEVVKYAQKLQDWGARNILVSMAEKGAVLVCEDGEIYQQRAFRGDVKNSVGAGDSMLAGFLTAYVRTGSLTQALNLGVAAGCA
ncbi:MAG: 1-phosphofructokinase, partial [Oscillospiraceae bacterium]|nr:1-phosphofructokinase [Oscillospiraceae bacterium]